MLGIGVWEVAVILVIALIIWGPEDLARQTRKIARFTRGIVRSKNELINEFENMSNVGDAKPNIDESRESPQKKYE